MSDTTAPSPPRPPWWSLAAEALVAARELAAAGRPGDATITKPLEQVAQQFGSDVMPQVILAWIDTALANSGYKPGGNAGVLWKNLRNGEVQGADDVPPPVRWAGRAFVARANDDEATFRALCYSAETDREWSSNVVELLMLCGRFLHHGITTTRINPLIRPDRGGL